MAKFTINNTDFDSRLMDGETQSLITKRLAGVFGLITVLSEDIEAALPADREPTLDDVRNSSDLLLPIAREISAMRDEDFLYIMNACIAVTTRKVDVGVGWVPVRQSGGFNHMQDGAFDVRMGIMWHVLRENFAHMASKLGLGALSAPAAGNA